MHDIKLLLIGFVSGIVSYLLACLGVVAFFLLPGTVYGLFLGFYYYHTKQVVPQRANNIFIFTAISTLAYVMAILGAAVISNNFLDYISLNPEIYGEPIFSFIISGIIGAAILLAGLHYFIKPLTLGQFIRLVLFGGALGLTWFVIPPGTIFPHSSYMSSPFEGIFGVLIFWQMGMTLAIETITKNSTDGYFQKTSK